jgi:sporulation protein YlmC with PRC-barrel domain
MNDAGRNTHDKPETPGENAPPPRLMRADTLIGENVYNLEGIELGDIKDIMLDVNAGSIAYAVLSFGGFLGIAEKLFAVPWKALKPDDVYKRFILDIDKERLESAPGFDKDHWPDMADPTWQNTISSYYGTKAYTDTTSTEPRYTETPRKTDTKSTKDERIIPVAPVGTDHVSKEVDDYTHK